MLNSPNDVRHSNAMYTVDIPFFLQDNFGNTALVKAVDSGHLHIVEILVKNRANVNFST